MAATATRPKRSRTPRRSGTVTLAESLEARDHMRRTLTAKLAEIRTLRAQLHGVSCLLGEADEHADLLRSQLLIARQAREQAERERDAALQQLRGA
jgi:hypothetical protein